MIAFQEVSAGYNSRQVLNGISFTAPAGKITSLVGPNGCGKSTLLGTVCGIIRPSSGRITVDGAPIHSYSRRQLARKIALLPQSRDIPAITVGRLATHGRYPHLGFGRQLTRQDREIIERALRVTGAWELQDRELRNLSGGERQRAYIAMALSQDSEALLLDEPTTYLDIGQKFQVMELIRQLNAQGKTILAVLHDLELAFLYSDLIAVIEAGQLIAFGPPETVCEKAARVFGVKCMNITLDGDKRIIFY